MSTAEYDSTPTLASYLDELGDVRLRWKTCLSGCDGSHVIDEDTIDDPLVQFSCTDCDWTSLVNRERLLNAIRPDERRDGE